MRACAHTHAHTQHIHTHTRRHIFKQHVVVLYFQYVQKSRKLGVFLLWLCIRLALVLLSFSVLSSWLTFLPQQPKLASYAISVVHRCRSTNILTLTAAASRTETPAWMGGRKQIPQSPWELGPFPWLHLLHWEVVEQHKMDSDRWERKMHSECS